MRAGELDRRVRLEEKSVTQNEFGEEVETWSEIDTVWASKREQRVMEAFGEDQRRGEIVTIWKTRWMDGITVIDRLIDLQTSRTYDIHGVKELGRKEGLEITGEARTE